MHTPPRPACLVAGDLSASSCWRFRLVLFCVALAPRLIARWLPSNGPLAGALGERLLTTPAWLFARQVLLTREPKSLGPMALVATMQPGLAHNAHRCTRRAVPAP